MPDREIGLRQSTVVIRFYGDLNFLLAAKYSQCEVRISFRGRQTIKHLVESLGVPHTEVDLIVSNGRVVTFSYVPADGEHLAVYPSFNNLDISDIYLLRPLLREKPRFALDGHLGRLAAYLRMLGFDALYSNHIEDKALADVATSQQRVLLTRDRGLLKRDQVVYGCCLLTLNPRCQLLQVVRRYRLTPHINPFTRCMACNGELIVVRKADILEQLEPKTRLYFMDFKRCTTCGKVFWAGSHHARMQTMIERLYYQAGDAHLR